MTNTKDIIVKLKEVRQEKELSFGDILNLLDKERTNFQKSLNFCKEQIALKDKRIDQLLDTSTKLLNQLLVCPCRKEKQ